MQPMLSCQGSETRYRSGAEWQLASWSNQRNAIFFISFFWIRGHLQHLIMSQMLYWHVFEGYGLYFWFSESKIFVKKITPALKKLKPWQVYVKYSNRVYFVECTRHQAFFKTHAYSANFRIFQATGFQNIGKLNAISNVILFLPSFIPSFLASFICLFSSYWFYCHTNASYDNYL